MEEGSDQEIDLDAHHPEDWEMPDANATDELADEKVDGTRKASKKHHPELNSKQMTIQIKWVTLRARETRRL